MPLFLTLAALKLFKSPATQKQLAARTGQSQQTISRHVHQLKVKVCEARNEKNQPVKRYQL